MEKRDHKNVDVFNSSCYCKIYCKIYRPIKLDKKWKTVYGGK